MGAPERESARAAWRAAASFPELCELGARFVEGRLAWFPGWGAETTDEETDAIAATLAALHRAGFLTVASQRGVPDRRGADGRIERRRAFVCGFADGRAAEALHALADPRLAVATFGATEEGGAELPVGLRGGEPFLVAGHAAGPRELELFAHDLSPAGMAALRAARYAGVVDLGWGRDDLLWKLLAAALGTGAR